MDPSPADLAAAQRVLGIEWFERARAAAVPGMRRLRRLSDAAARAAWAVHGIGSGEKVVLGCATPTRAVRVYVIQKLPRRLLSGPDRLPGSIDGIPVDVVECPPAFLTPLRRATSTVRSGPKPTQQQRCDPVTSGISIGRDGVGFGTLGAFCTSTNPGESQLTLFLSNNHVLAGSSSTPGDPIFQPGPADATGAPNEIGRLLRAFPIEPGSQTNQIDAAVAQLVGVKHDLAIPEIGFVLDTGRARVNTFACKFGRTTGLTRGIIGDVNHSEVVGLDRHDPSKTAMFHNQIRIDRIGSQGLFADDGDSGSLIMAEGTGRAVGLYFAGPLDGRFGIANHIATVMERLRITLLTAP